MVVNFISADYGWLSSPNGSDSAQVLSCAGKNCEKCFTNDDVLAQMHKAITIVKKYYPNDDHVFVFDNATTHAKHASTALSACHMPKDLS